MPLAARASACDPGLKIIHFGKGRIESRVALPPGRHTLQLLVGDYLHIPNARPVASKKLTITVQ